MARGGGATVALYVAHVLATLIFLVGFFPAKTPIQGGAKPEDILRGAQIGNDYSVLAIRDGWTRRKVGQVVIVLIDALRADFVLDHAKLREHEVDYGPIGEMPKLEFLRRKISQREAACYIAQATPPTVTLPRIKALTTGGIPGFVDVILNFGSTTLNEDNLLRQWREHGRNITFFGDDTWLKLFPEAFLRSDGTTSFFVADYTEVDNNVTRHLDEELKQNDWDVMILHYLGLDHIGHFAGPWSPLVVPKLLEMDNIIESIHDQLERKHLQSPAFEEPPLLIILGDHGMSDSGSHGGASLSEIITPIVFLEPGSGTNPLLKAQIRRVAQPDFVPSLSLLTGIPIPLNNYGIIIPDFFRYQEASSFIGSNLEVGCLLYNAFQISQVMERNIPSYEKDFGYDLLQKSIREFSNVSEAQSISNIRASIRVMVETLRSNVLEYNISYMGLGIICNIGLFGLLTLNLSVVGVISPLLIAMELLKIFSLGSTSFIEEQHQTIYFVTQTAFLMLAFRTRSLKSLLLLVLIRLGRSWNQTGDKWAHLADTADWLILPDNQLILSAVHGLSLLGLLAYSWKPRPQFLALALAYGCVYWHNMAEGSVITIFQTSEDDRGVNGAQGVFVSALVYFCGSVFARTEVQYTPKGSQWIQVGLEAFLPVASVLSPPQNTVLLLVEIILLEHVSRGAGMPHFGAVDSFLVSLNIGYSTYFSQGNSNSLATIDVGAGYTGLSGFHPGTVSLLIALNTYSGLLIALAAFFKHHPATFSWMMRLLLLIRSLELGFFQALVTLERYHLFVWTVFSPKLLYEATLSLLFALIYRTAWDTGDPPKQDEDEANYLWKRQLRLALEDPMAKLVNGQFPDFRESSSTYLEIIAQLKALFQDSTSEFQCFTVLIDIQQKPAEAFADFYGRLVDTASSCGFPDTTARNFVVRDLALRGTSSQAMRANALQNRWTASQLLAWAQEVESSTAVSIPRRPQALLVEHSECEPTGDGSAVTTHRVAGPYAKTNRHPKPKPVRLLRSHHPKGKVHCPAVDKTWESCHFIGHVAKMCRSASRRAQHIQIGNVRYVPASYQDSAPYYAVMQLRMGGAAPAMAASICLHRSQLFAIVDTGAQVNIAPLRLLSPEEPSQKSPDPTYS
eukprot:maker-scaffold1628_size33005-snap-gene-0.8 protein:Tk10479 transcript:maker-scaffold1628_size33005-snap-gene-0.8-mRNA-1 annotation:"gpi ethanolamine phosphate transferase 2-like"